LGPFLEKTRLMYRIGTAHVACIWAKCVFCSIRGLYTSISVLKFKFVDNFLSISCSLYSSRWSKCSILDNQRLLRYENNYI